MAEQTSRLAIIIDSTGAKNNADNLTSSLVKMTQAGETAANSAGKVTKATEDEKNALAKLKAAIGAHTHSVAIGSHGHTITVNAADNAENTVKNIAFNYIVRLA
ncbi:TPA: hypothetical protein OGN03_004523 [Escherichia coli]|uniref:hypothetical protein n=1 Tax=Escherichia coli TaxID=562 RepID=UPI0007E90856|nr:hypothetical protein [Escherichia coli]ELE8679456.1 hypothetical protein [Escherichia coli]MDD8548310.1 hypothetical protein [Escherichia coli]HCP9911488.1 hypothetical protein [Escherichia coli]